jgi:putative transposase
MVGLSEAGSIIHQYWADIPHHFPNASVDAFIVMPDHLHGIIHIDSQHANVNELSGLGRIIQQFKRACTARIHTFHPGFRWHRNFNDHVIRHEGEYDRIRRYILNNPGQWGIDGHV